MTTYIEYTEGKVYEPAHLKPFVLELAKQGHPCADIMGRELRLLREHSSGNGSFNFDVWQGSYWATNYNSGKYLCLAPLSIKDGKPLHAGDVIEEKIVMFGGNGWKKTVVTLQNWDVLFKHGRWPQGDK
jgi:hypothetical protein